MMLITTNYQNRINRMGLSLRTNTENIIAQRRKPLSNRALTLSMFSISFLTFTVPLLMGHIAVIGLWAGPLSIFLMTTFEDIRDKRFAKKIRQYLLLHKKFPLSPWKTQYLENRDGHITSLDSLEDATTDEVYCVTETEFTKVVIQRDPMELWDKALKDVKSVYSLKGKKALTKTV